MKARTRLKRRILRDHRRLRKVRYMASHWEEYEVGWTNWYCPHCWAPRSASERVDGVPHAYR